MIIYEEILKAFQKQKVKYVVVGGIAVNLLGSLRSTADLDILIEMSDKNLSKVIKILKNLGYKVKRSIDPMQLAKKEVREDWIKNEHMKAFNFYKAGGIDEVDIIIESPVSYEVAKKDALLIKVGNIKIPVISIDNLIRMKKKSGRKIDKFDIDELKEIKKLRKKK